VTPLDQLRMHVVLPVVVADDPDCAVSLRDALVEGGLPLAEVTFRTGPRRTSSGCLPHEGTFWSVPEQC
jgi:2-dehydro-3-deoxyphosphogluconate aldolase/(4S)-4-hydroxy-2-oxoglutarate aldolase